MNRQWLGFENAPKTNFLNFSYTIRPPRGYKYWQNGGIYYDSEDAGLTGSSGIYGTYALHLLLHKTTTLSFGVFAGARLYNRSLFGFDANDPAVQKSVSSLWVYPDIIPGIRLTNRHYYFGMSMRQMTIGSLKGYKGRRIGSPSILNPNLFIEAGKTIEVAEQVLMMPSMAINIPLIAPPTLDATLMFYMANRVGLGAAIRNTNFISGIFQIRFLQNMTAGFAYSYPINRTRYVAGSSFEVMVGIIPTGMSNKLVGIGSIARCPNLSY
jgi:type IX secretion system PorP/SprF family membrane protein